MAKKRRTHKDEYAHQLKLLKDRILTAERAGFIFEKSPIPSIPKRITQSSIESLKRLRGETLRSKAKYVNVETGELVSGKYGTYLQRKQAGEKAHKTKVSKSPKKYSKNRPIYDYVPEPSEKPVRKITVNDIKAEKDPELRRYLWELYFEQEHPEAKEYKPMTPEEFDKVLEEKRDWSRVFPEKKKRRPEEYSSPELEEKQIDYYKNMLGDFEEEYGTEYVTIETFLAEIKSVGANAPNGDGYKLIEKEIARALRNKKFGETRKERLEKLADAIQEAREEGSADFRQIAYIEQVASSFFNDILSRIPTVSKETKQAVADSMEKQELGWHAGQ